MASDPLSAHADRVREQLAAKHAAREAALAASRDAIRHAANAIRAVHRDAVDTVAEELAASAERLAAGRESARDHPEIATAGFVADAEKEYAEARLTAAGVREAPLPGPSEVGVPAAAWLNGLAETVGELRRRVLDRLRAGQLDEADRLLAVMDDIYAVLVTMDFPEGITGGLRRATDVARGLLERTRGDVTTALTQQRLQDALDRHTDALGSTGHPAG